MNLFFAWSDLEQVTYSSLRENPAFFFAKQKSYPNIAVRTNDFNLDANELKELVFYHCEKHGIELCKIGGFSKEQVVLSERNNPIK